MNCPHCSVKVEGMIPQDRFNEVNEAKKLANAELQDLKLQLVDSDNLKQQIAELGAQLASTTTGNTNELAIARAGIFDPDDAADLMALHARRAGDTPLGDWLADRDALPRAARALFPQPPSTPTVVATPSSSTPAVATPAVVAPPPATQPAANRGAANFTAAPSAFSAVEISKMSRQEYKANREAIMRSLQKN